MERFRRLDIVGTTRVVVGPDEPYGDRSYENMRADHWISLGEVLARQGIEADAGELSRLPHDLMLSQRLLARLRATQPPKAAADQGGP